MATDDGVQLSVQLITNEERTTTLPDNYATTTGDKDVSSATEESAILDKTVSETNEKTSTITKYCLIE